MDRNDEWRLFINQLQESALKACRETREHELEQLRHEHLYSRLETDFTPEQSAFIEDFLFELISFREHEAELLYNQGLQDGIWMLKKLSVIA